MKFMFSKLEKAYFVSYSKDVILKASPDRKVRKNMERIIKKMDGSSVYTDLKPNEVKDVASLCMAASAQSESYMAKYRMLPWHQRILNASKFKETKTTVDELRRNCESIIEKLRIERGRTKNSNSNGPEKKASGLSKN